MSLQLSRHDVKRIATATQTLLTPLSHADVRAWAEAAMRDVGAVVGADRTLAAVPIDGHAELFGSDAEAEAAMDAYVRYFHSVDFAFNERRVSRGLEIYPTWILYASGEQENTELFNDWCVPYRVCDAIGMGVQFDMNTLPAGIHVYHDTETGSNRFTPRDAALLELLLPAFKAGVSTVRHFALTRHHVFAMIDRMPGMVVIFDMKGRRLHENAAYAASRGLLQFSAIDLAVTTVANAALPQLTPRRGSLPNTGHANLSRIVQLPTESVRVSASIVLDPAQHTPLVAVVVERVSPTFMSASEVQRRYRLTARQVQVAMLLREGLPNAEIAARLGVSVHTAERHTEDVLRKLGVSSRAAVTIAMMTR